MHLNPFHAILRMFVRLFFGGVHVLLFASNFVKTFCSIALWLICTIIGDIFYNIFLGQIVWPHVHGASGTGGG